MSRRPTEQSSRQDSYSGNNDRPQQFATAPSIRPHGSEHPHLPPASSLEGQDGSSRFTTRLAGVDSILNPPLAEDHLSGRRRKASGLDPTDGLAPSLPPLAMVSQPTSSIQGRIIIPPAAPIAGPVDRPVRRILTPRSPTLHRAASLSQLQPLSASHNAPPMPFPGSPQSRTYAIALGTSGVPPLPVSRAAARNDYKSTGPTPSSEAARRAGRDTRALSGSASPTTSYSSYGQAEQTSPSSQYALMSSGPLSYGGGAATAAVGIPISSSAGQNTYQMMTLETTSGTVQLPVDVQAASRVADEKRRRNAGASARFRQRRKEKEKEASVTIGKLDQQVKELGEDADFYRRERDYLSDALTQAPGGDRHFPRPPSPRRRRTSATQLPPSSTAGREFPGGSQEVAQRSPEQGRNVRRRLSNVSLPPPSLPHLALQPPGTTPFQPGYSMRQGGLLLAPQPAPPSEQQRAAHDSPGRTPSRVGDVLALAPAATTLPAIQAALGAPQLMQAPPTTGPWNPYAVPDRRGQYGASGPSGPR
ncbi:hypothetical protein LTR53_000794 [Teratosphaeriaceae sp. CCFEE 6253]|nr:hypothetical protein LTR53_000794 [Teratosphaeriaceae sp. CCFEE 6253]